MARTEPLPVGVTQVLAARIGARLAALASTAGEGTAPQGASLARAARDFLAGGESPLLAESFPLWMLGPASLHQPLDDLRLLARPVGRWHHQIKFPGGLVAYARSQPIGSLHDPASWSVRELFEGLLAQRIEQAIDAIDREVPDRFLTRLLSSPGYLLNALWMIDEQSGEQKIRILTAPPSFPQLPSGRLQDAGEFLRLLRSIPSVRGLLNDLTSPPFGDGLDVALRIRLRRTT